MPRLIVSIILLTLLSTASPFAFIPSPISRASKCISQLGSTPNASEKPLSDLSTKELKETIRAAGLSHVGVLEKDDLVALATKASEVLAEKPMQNEDAAAWRDLDVVFYGRETCPWCVVAAEVCEKRGIPTYLDVEKDPLASAEFRKFGAKGLPFFVSRKTGKTAAGWGRGATDLMFIIEKLS